jgi:hypothetical protein
MNSSWKPLETADDAGLVELVDASVGQSVAMLVRPEKNVIAVSPKRRQLVCSDRRPEYLRAIRTGFSIMAVAPTGVRLQQGIFIDRNWGSERSSLRERTRYEC